MRRYSSGSKACDTHVMWSLDVEIARAAGDIVGRLHITDVSPF